MNAIPEQYREIVSHFVSTVKTNTENYDMLAPIVIFFNTKDGTQVPITSLFTNADEKMAFSIALKEISKKLKPDLVVGAFESWMATTTGRYEGAVKDHPDAYEAVMISVETRNGSWHCSAKIGKDRKLELPDPLFKESRLEGIFSNFIHLKSVLH